MRKGVAELPGGYARQGVATLTEKTGLVCRMDMKRTKWDPTRQQSTARGGRTVLVESERVSHLLSAPLPLSPRKVPLSSWLRDESPSLETLLVPGRRKREKGVWFKISGRIRSLPIVTKDCMGGVVWPPRSLGRRKVAMMMIG